MTEWLLLLLKISIVAMILAIGMGSTFSDVTYLWKRPGLLLRSLLAMYIVVPLAALIIVRVFPIFPGIKAALLVLAVSAGAPLLPKKLKAVGNSQYIFSLVVITSVLAIVLVPAWVAVLADLFQARASVSPSTVMMAIVKAFLLPLLAGMIFRAMMPAWARKLSDRLLLIAGLVLILGGVTLLALNWQVFLVIHWQGISALVAFMVLALAIGHLMGGPAAGDRIVLAVACSTRHIGIAVLVATAFPGPRTAVLVAGYVVTAAVISLSYLAWQKSRLRSASGETRTRPGA